MTELSPPELNGLHGLLMKSDLRRYRAAGNFPPRISGILVDDDLNLGKSTVRLFDHKGVSAARAGGGHAVIDQ